MSSSRPSLHDLLESLPDSLTLVETAQRFDQHKYKTNELSTPNAKGETPLMIVLRRKHYNAARVLIGKAKQIINDNKQSSINFLGLPTQIEGVLGAKERELEFIVSHKDDGSKATDDRQIQDLLFDEISNYPASAWVAALRNKNLYFLQNHKKKCNLRIFVDEVPSFLNKIIPLTVYVEEDYAFIFFDFMDRHDIWNLDKHTSKYADTNWKEGVSFDLEKFSPSALQYTYAHQSCKDRFPSFSKTYIKNIPLKYYQQNDENLISLEEAILAIQQERYDLLKYMLDKKPDLAQSSRLLEVALTLPKPNDNIIEFLMLHHAVVPHASLENYKGRFERLLYVINALQTSAYTSAESLYKNLNGEKLSEDDKNLLQRIYVEDEEKLGKIKEFEERIKHFDFASPVSECLATVFSVPRTPDLAYLRSLKVITEGAPPTLQPIIHDFIDQQIERLSQLDVFFESKKSEQSSSPPKPKCA